MASTLSFKIRGKRYYFFHTCIYILFNDNLPRIFINYYSRFKILSVLARYLNLSFSFQFRGKRWKTCSNFFTFYLGKQKVATILEHSREIQTVDVGENRRELLVETALEPFLIPFTVEYLALCIALFVSPVAPPKVCLTSSLLLMHCSP